MTHFEIDSADSVGTVLVGVTEPLGWAFWPLGVLCVLAADGRDSGGGVSPHGGSHGSVDGVGVFDNMASS